MRRAIILRLCVAGVFLCFLAASVFSQEQKGYCFDCAVDASGSRLFLAAGAVGTHVYNLASGAPQYAFTIPAEGGGYHRNLKISGDYCFVADAKKFLMIYDIRKQTPALVYKGTASDGMGVDVRGDVIYVAWGKNGLAIGRFTPPGSIELLGTCSTNGEAWDVWVGGNYAYVANVDTGLAVMDVTDPKTPRFVRNVGWHPPVSTGEIVRGENNLLCVAAGEQGMPFFDITKPDNPVLVSHFAAGVENCAEGVAVKDGIVYMAMGNRGTPAVNGLMLMDAHQPAHLKFLGRAVFPGWVEGVCVMGTFAYVANTNEGLRCVNVSNLSAPVIVEVAPAPAQALTAAPMGQDIKGKIDGLPWVGAKSQAVEVFKEAKQSGFANSDAWLKLGLVLADAHAYSEALEAFEQVGGITGYRGNAGFVAMVWEGHVLDLMGQRDEAVKRYKRALELDKGYAMRHDQFGIVVNRQWVEGRLKEPFQFKRK